MSASRALAWHAALSTLLCSCSPPASLPAASAPTSPAPAPSCVLHLPEPDLSSFPPAQTPDWPRSRIVSNLEIPISAIASRLATEVPNPVSSARNVDAGAAGRLTYTVRRSPFSLDVREGRLLAFCELVAEAEVCKPLGPLGCVSYGSCSPAAHAEASIPLQPRADWGLGHSRVGIGITRSCRLGPLDATPILQQGAQAQAARMQARIDRLLPSLEPQARALWQSPPIEYEDGSSRLRFVPDCVVVGSASSNRQSIFVPVGLRGAFVPAVDPPAKLPSLPAPCPAEDLAPGIELEVPGLVSPRDLDSRILSALSATKLVSGSLRGEVRAVRTLPTGAGLLVVATTGGGLCGDVGLLVTPTLQEITGELRFDVVGSVPTLPGAGEPDPSVLRDLQAALSLVAVPVEHPRAPLQAAARACSTMLEARGTHLEPGASTVHPTRAVVDPRGVVVFFSFRQSASSPSQ